MSVRFLILITSFQLILGCLATTAAMAQILGEGLPPEPGDALGSPDSTYSLENLGESTFGGAIPENRFLLRHQGRLFGLRFLSNSMDMAVDYGPDSALRGDPYWDEYGLGTYYTALGGSPSVNQIWHTNFTNGEHRQITDGRCITGVGGLTRAKKCVYAGPIASSVNRMAFVQEIFDYDPDATDAQIPESVQKQIVVGANGTLRSVRYEESPPDHMDWSPDGQWLVYAAKGILNVLVLVDPDTVAVKHCPLWDDVQTQIRHPEWAWDGGLWIVYETANDIWRVPVQKPRGKGTCPTLQLNRAEQLTDSGYEDSRPQWMNFNNWIVFGSRRPLDPADTSSVRRLWAVEPGGNDPAAVVFMPFSLEGADWQRVRETPAEQKKKDAIRNARGQGGI